MGYLDLRISRRPALGPRAGSWVRCPLQPVAFLTALEKIAALFRGLRPAPNRLLLLEGGKAPDIHGI